MNAAAYLTSHGWRGSGYALDPNGKGLSRPLLVSKKGNVLGVGKKAHDAHADQWWSRAFDETLRSLNDQTATQKITPSVAASAKPPSVVPNRWTTNGGLYGGFVRGEGLMGTMGSDQDVMETETDALPPTKRRKLGDSGKLRAERDQASTKNHSKKSTSDQPSFDTNSQKCIASAAAIEPSANVSPLRNGFSTRDTYQQEVIQNNKTHLAKSSTTYSEVAGSTIQSSASPILEAADDIEFAGQGEFHEHRSKRKERRLRGQGSINGAASNGRETEPNTDHRIKKKKKRKRQKDEGS
ncbi:MAG: hypothetical protein Q9226_002576 [Calogaya cf. arnoldii]